MLDGTALTSRGGVGMTDLLEPPVYVVADHSVRVVHERHCTHRTSHQKLIRKHKVQKKRQRAAKKNDPRHLFFFGDFWDEIIPLARQSVTHAHATRVERMCHVVG